MLSMLSPSMVSVETHIGLGNMPTATSGYVIYLTKYPEPVCIPTVMILDMLSLEAPGRCAILLDSS